MQQAVAEEPLKDVSAYKAEVAGYVKSSKQYLESAEKQIQRGKLKMCTAHALYPKHHALCIYLCHHFD